METQRKFFNPIYCGTEFCSEIATLTEPRNITYEYLESHLNVLNLEYIWIVANVSGSSALSTLLIENVDNDDINDLLTSEVPNSNPDSEEEQKFMKFYLKSENLGESVVPQNDCIFLHVQSRLAITIGNPLYEGDIVNNLLGMIAQKRITSLYFPLAFNEVIVDKLLTYIEKWNYDIEQLLATLNRYLTFGNTFQRLRLSVMGHKHLKEKMNVLKNIYWNIQLNVITVPLNCRNLSGGQKGV